jgi:hypothetical protein
MSHCCCHGGYRAGAQANQITHRFVSGIGYPDARQFTRSVKPGQHGGISAICLDPVARADRDKRWGDDLAFKSKAHQLAVKAVAAWTGLVDEAQASAT